MLEVSTGDSTHLGPFPGDSADAVALVEQRLICCWKQGILKQTPGLLALPPQRGERLALVWNHHPPKKHTGDLFMLSLVFFVFVFYILPSFLGCIYASMDGQTKMAELKGYQAYTPKFCICETHIVSHIHAQRCAPYIQVMGSSGHVTG